MRWDHSGRGEMRWGEMRRDEAGWDKTRQNSNEFGRIWKNLEEFERIWKNSKEFGRIWKNLEESGRIWKNLKELDRIWKKPKDFERIERILKNFWVVPFPLFRFVNSCVCGAVLDFCGFLVWGGFIGALFPLRSMIMKQNEPKWSKMKTLHVRRFGKIWMIFSTIFWKN